MIKFEHISVKLGELTIVLERVCCVFWLTSKAIWFHTSNLEELARRLLKKLRIYSSITLQGTNQNILHKLLSNQISSFIAPTFQPRSVQTKACGWGNCESRLPCDGGVQWNLSIADMLNSGHLSIADTFFRNQLSHTIVKPLDFEFLKIIISYLATIISITRYSQYSYKYL